MWRFDLGLIIGVLGMVAFNTWAISSCQDRSPERQCIASISWPEMDKGIIHFVPAEGGAHNTSNRGE